MPKENIIRILFVQDKVEDCEQVISVLRNGGIAVRPERVADDLAFDNALEKHAPDLVLADPDTKGLALDIVARKITASGKDVAVIALVLNATNELIVESFALGIRGVALSGHSDQLQAVVSREFEALTMRRSVRRLEAALRESERRCDSLLESSREPVAYVHEGMHVRANQAYLDLFSLQSFDDLEGLTLLDLIAPSEAADFKDLLKRLSRGEKPPDKLEINAQSGDGSEFHAVMQFAKATFEGEPCLQIIFRRQQTVDPELSRQIDELRWRDPVTGLFNRAHILAQIDDAVAAAADGRSNQALLLIDPDNYRSTLDTIGLASADSLLHGLAKIIAAELGEYDFAGRISDHTFSVLLTGRDHKAVAELADHLRQAVAAHIFDAGTQSISMTVSIGGSLLGEKNASAHALLDQAGERLRAIHDQGGNQVDVFNPAAQEVADAERELRWRESIENALKEDKFVLFYQQVISLQGAEGDYFEILLRMKGPQGEILPGQFLPAAERHGLLPQIDRWVLSKAIALLAERLRDGQATTFLIKLTSQSLTDEALADWIGNQLKVAKVPGNALVLEMPESKVLTSLKPARTFVEKIKKFGCAFALEQFGSGLNSFQLLQHVPADYLKIDRSFLAELPKSPENQQRVREICAEAREHKRMTIAEWVQDAASTSILFSCGVHFVQGNFLQEPEKVVSAEAVH